MRRTTLLIVAWIVFLLAVRWHFSPATTPDDRGVDYAAIRDQVQALVIRADGVPTDRDWQSLKSMGVQELRFQRFDPDARVVVGVGNDEQPGVSGIDDGFNGVVDDRDELGATGSDDTFDVVSSSDWNPTDRPPVESILSIGGWVAATNHPERCLVIGNGFEMMVSLTSEHHDGHQNPTAEH